MPIHKHRAEAGNPYGRLDMQTIRDPNLSNAEIGLLLRLISLPDTWQYTEIGYCHVYPADGQTSLRTQLKSLEAKGYIQRIHHQRDARGLYLKTTLLIRETQDNQ